MQHQIALLLYLIVSTAIFATEPPPKQLKLGSSLEQKNYKFKGPFAPNYITYEVGKNSPMLHSVQNLRGEYATYTLGFHHLLTQDWMMGFSFGFKSFRRKDTNQELSLASLNHESYYILRLYHPIYVALGIKLHYFVPSQRSRFPIIKDTDYDSDTGFGAGLSINFIKLFTKKWLLSARLDRYRGTSTNRLHGLEVALGIGRSI